MRQMAMATILAAFALAGCGGSEPEEAAVSGEGMSSEDVASAMEDVVSPRAGQYESTMEVLQFEVPGMPAEQADQMRAMMAEQGAMTSSFCLTPEEAAEGPQRMVQEMAEANCVFDRFDVSGGTMQAEMQCTGEEGIQGHYELDGAMTEESSTMTMRVEQQAPGVPGEGNVRIQMRVTSQRVGDCA